MSNKSNKNKMQDEKLLIKRCLKHDQKALSELYNNFSGKMYGICLRYAKNKMDADDLLHDGFVRVLKNLKAYRGEGSFEGWMRRIMVNTSINFYRKKTNHVETDISEVYGLSDNSFDDAISQISVKELLVLIQDLPDGYRLVFNMYVMEGYKHKEIAEILNISENTSKSQLLKAKATLKKKLNEKYKIKENVSR